MDIVLVMLVGCTALTIGLLAGTVVGIYIGCKVTNRPQVYQYPHPSGLAQSVPSASEDSVENTVPSQPDAELGNLPVGFFIEQSLMGNFAGTGGE